MYYYNFHFFLVSDGSSDDALQKTIYSFMQFPRGWPSDAISVHPNSMIPIFQSSNMDVSENALAMDVNLLKKLLISGDNSCNKEVSQHNLSVHHFLSC